MAELKIVRQKEKRYVFDFFDNRKDPNPAAVIFARFPLPYEDFIPVMKRSVFNGIDLKKFMDGDPDQQDKYLSAVGAYANSEKIINSLNFLFVKLEIIKMIYAFADESFIIRAINLSIEAWTLIANDCYQYARQRDEFSMGNPGEIIKG